MAGTTSPLLLNKVPFWAIVAKNIGARHAALWIFQADSRLPASTRECGGYALIVRWRVVPRVFLQVMTHGTPPTLGMQEQILAARGRVIESWR